MSNIQKGLASSEERLQFLNEECNRVELLCQEKTVELKEVNQKLEEEKSVLNDFLSNKNKAVEELETKIASKSKELEDTQDVLSSIELKKEELEGCVDDLCEKIKSNNEELSDIEEKKNKVLAETSQLIADGKNALIDANEKIKELNKLAEKNQLEAERLSNLDIGLQHKLEKLDEQTISLSKREDEIKSLEAALVVRESVVADKEKNTELALSNSKYLETEATATYQEAKNKLAEVSERESKLAEKENLFIKRERELASREQDYVLRSAEFDNKERAIKIKEKSLKLDNLE